MSPTDCSQVHSNMKLYLPLLALLGVIQPTLLDAQFGLSESPVKAELVPELNAIIPGQAFTVALRLDHDPKWHTYWKSSSTGYATSLEWDLPEGFSASGIHWPVPKIYVQDFIVDFVHDGVTYLLVDITPPKDLEEGTEVTLRAKADWLMCEQICIPGESDVSLTLPVVASMAEAGYGEDAEAIQQTRSELPRDPQLWDIRATKEDGHYKLTLSARPEAEHDPEELYFFSDNGLIVPEKDQTIESTEDGYRLTLPIDTAASDEIEYLSGVLKSMNGWGPATESQGLQIKLTLSGEPITTATTSSGEINVFGTESSGGVGFVAAIGLAFLGGLILNLMPCVFPVLGIKIMGFVNQAGESKKRVFHHGLSYTIGVLISFWVLALLILGLRATGDISGWGFQFQSPAFVFVITAVILLFGLNMSGVFEIGQSLVGTGTELQSKGGLKGSFFSGVLATIVATPCSAPFLGAALGVALSSPPTQLIIILSAVGLGLSSPYLVLSVFPSLVKYLPRPGPWMESFKQFMAFLLYATVAYLVWVASSQLSVEALYGSYGFLHFLFGLVAIALGAWIYGRWTQPHRKASIRRIGMVTAILVLTAGLLGGWPTPADEESYMAAADSMYAEAPRAALTGESQNFHWSDWQPGLAEELAAEGKTVYVDFTAKWCVTCQTNKATVFSSSEVFDRFREEGIIALRADWTARNPAITEALKRFDRAAVPLNVIYQPGESPTVLPSILTPGIVLQTLK